MRNACALVVIVFLFQPLAALHADGGIVRFSERQGDYRITVFTSPNPLRAGPVDVSVLVQDAATGEPISGARITVQASPRAHPDESITFPATKEAATNKLFQAALFDLPEAGWWDVAIKVEGLPDPVEVHFEMEADQPLPHVWEIIPWIAWPIIVIVLFFAHKWLVHRKRCDSPRIKKAGFPKGEPALVTCRPIT
jgi:hypothetical protein